MWNTSVLVPNEALNAAMVCVVTPPGANVGGIRQVLQDKYNTYGAA
jgi:hypothetical protein